MVLLSKVLVHKRNYHALPTQQCMGQRTWGGGDETHCLKIFSALNNLFHHILHASDHCSLQSGINELRDWTQNWLLKININKLRFCL